MFTKFPSESRQVVVAAREIAVDLAAPNLEAEHLLLAVARQPDSNVHGVLVEAGLDYDRTREALDAEFEGSLAIVGVSVGELDLRAAAGTRRAPRWGTSAKLALERSVKIADARRERRITPAHIVLGILAATRGMVPRALARVGVDRAELRDRVAAAI